MDAAYAETPPPAPQHRHRAEAPPSSSTRTTPPEEGAPLPQPSHQHQRLSWSQSFLLNHSNSREATSRSSLVASGHPEPNSQEILTQTAVDLFSNTQTQLAGYSSSCEGELSPLPPYSPSQQRQVPWGRLLPQGQHALANRATATTQHAATAPSSLATAGGITDLLPRSPARDSDRTPGRGVSYLGLDHLLPCDVFNVYVLGRSAKADVPVLAPIVAKGDDQSDNKTSQTNNVAAAPTQALYDWAHAMISNQHCRIYCCLASSASSATTTSTTPPSMEVYVEDSSGNGTLINQTTLLRRGQKRLLHSGDQVCLVSPITLRKKIRSTQVLQQVLRQYSFVFVNLQQQQQPQKSLPGIWHTAAASNKKMLPPPPQPANLFSSVTAAAAVGPQQPANNNRKTAVNVHALHSSLGAAGQHNNNKTSAQQQQPLSFGFQPPRPAAAQARPRRIEEVYDLRDLLGSGTVGQVRRAIHRQTGQQVAVKTITLARQPPQHRGRGGLPPNGNNHAIAAATATLVEAEAAILRDLSHPYIVQLLDVFVSSEAVHIVMELVKGGDLLDRIVAKGRYEEVESRRVLRRILAAVHYLHQERNIVHRDLKPENILCVGTDNHVDVKLTDFGLAKAVNGDDGLKTFCGTPQYFAPEVLRRQHTVAGRGSYGKAADMWSLGVILYVLLSGTPPFDASQGLDGVDNAIITFPAEYFIGVSEPAKDLVRQLLVANPRERLDVRGACEHPWILTEDGDTHVHPLDDPRLKRLSFPPPAATKEAGTRLPAAKAVASPNDVPTKKPSTAENGRNGVGTSEAGDKASTATEGTTEMRPPLSPVVLNGKKALKDPAPESGSEPGQKLKPTKTETTSHVSSCVRFTDRMDCASSDDSEQAAKGKAKVSLDFDKPSAEKSASTKVTPGTSFASKKSPQSKTDSSKESNELSDDEIRSQFSDRTESISTFSSGEENGTGCDVSARPSVFGTGQTSSAQKKEDSQAAARTKRRRVTDATDKKLEKRNTTKKPKGGGKSKSATGKAGRGDDKTQKKGSGGKQTTLSSWFKKS